MKREVIKKLNNFNLGLAKKVAYNAAVYTANVTCTYVLHQPKVPEDVKKLRKF